MKSEAKEKIKALVEKYEEIRRSGKLKSYTEEETKKDLILPLLEALGWDVFDKNEVSAEENIISSGRVDYGVYLDGRAKFYLEAKKLSADLHREEFANQSIKYSWNKGVTWAVLTDFESLKVFNAQEIDKSLGDKLLFEIPYTKYLERFDEQLILLSKEAFEKGLIDKYAEEHGKKLQKISVSALLYKDLQKARDILTKNLAQWNEKVPKDLLDEGVQKLLDRLIFLRVAEDRGVESQTLIPMIRQWQAGGRKGSIYKSMIEKFREFDKIYNSNLFSPHPFEKWEEYDNTTEKVVNILYGKKGYYEYDFKAMPADVLGSVYENYLGYRLSQSKKGMTVDKDAKKRKEQGIYYTPSFVVDYIVKNALGPVLDKCKSIADLKKIKVLDPACGSGSFLVKALEMINDKYKSFGADGGVYTKLQILIENIYGVDLDEQAVEIARLNLLINALDERTKLPLLSDNIKNGNSLISGTDEELKKYFGKNFKEKKPFNWQEEFPEVFAQGGFDVIIGNPPWGANIDEDGEYLKNVFPNSTKEKKDTYKTFIDRSFSLLKATGRIGFVVPNSFLYQPSYEDLKALIKKYWYFVVNLGEHIFGNVELPCCILISDKGKTKENFIIDLTQENRELLPVKILSIDFKKSKKVFEKEKRLVKNTGLIFENVFNLKDAGIQYHRSGIGLSNKGGNDLYERIFCSIENNKFKNGKETFYGKLLFRYYLNDSTDEIFNLDYKTVLEKNESVSFSKEAFEQDEKILWRQTASTILAVIDNEKKWFRNTIQCAWIKKEYKGKLNIIYALAIFNSKYIDYVYRKKVLETGRVFPQVKLKYLRDLPFVIGTKIQQEKITELTKKMLVLNKELRKTPENSNKWNSTKEEIAKTDKKIDEEVYRLYSLTEEDVKIIEGK